MKICTNAQVEGILHMAFCLDGNSIKEVGEITGINRNALYKWNCGAMRFSSTTSTNGSYTFRSMNLHV